MRQQQQRQRQRDSDSVQQRGGEGRVKIEACVFFGRCGKCQRAGPRGRNDSATTTRREARRCCPTPAPLAAAAADARSPDEGGAPDADRVDDGAPGGGAACGSAPSFRARTARERRAAPY